MITIWNSNHISVEFFQNISKKRPLYLWLCSNKRGLRKCPQTKKKRFTSVNIKNIELKIFLLKTPVIIQGNVSRIRKRIIWIKIIFELLVNFIQVIKIYFNIIFSYRGAVSFELDYSKRFWRVVFWVRDIKRIIGGP